LALGFRGEGLGFRGIIEGFGGERERGDRLREIEETEGEVGR